MIGKPVNYKNILVTGGCGFIGSNFIRHFYNKYPDYRIYNLDLLTYSGNPENVADVETADGRNGEKSGRYLFIKGDICDAAFLDGLFKKYAFFGVVNFAAETHVDRSIISFGDFINTNINGVRFLIEAARKYNVPKFVHISTDEVYGSVSHGTSDESSPLRPSNPYSSSKAAADLILQSFIRTYNLPVAIVRGSNNYGTFQYPEKLIPLAISNIIDGKKVPVHGSGRHKRSWLHTRDFSEAIDSVFHNAKFPAIYNVSGEEMENIGVLETIAGKLGVDFNQHKEHIGDRPGADLRYAPDSSRIEKELGWSRKFNIRESIGDVVNWYLLNQDWWRKLKNKKEFQEYYKKQSTGQWY